MNSLSSLPENRGRKRAFRDLAVFAEAAALLSLAHLAIHGIPFRHIARAMMRRTDPSPSLDGRQQEQANRVRWAMDAAARRLPFGPRCLARSVAGKIMLNRRDVPAILHFGMRRSGVPKGQPRESGALVAHAWLTAGSMCVSGDDGTLTCVSVGRVS